MTEELICPRLLTRAVRRSPGARAVVDGDVTTSFAQLLARARRMAGFLRGDAGLGPADRFGVLAGNCTDFVALWQTACLGGGVIQPLDARLSAAELATRVDDGAPRVVFVDHANADRLREALGPTQARPAVVLLGAADDGAWPALDPILAGVTEDDFDEPVHEDDPVVLLYTGGTLGRPKGVVHVQRGLCLNFHRLQYMCDLSAPGSVYQLSTPLFHASGIIGAFGAPAAGALTVLRPRFDPGWLLDDIATHGVTHIGVVPTMLAMLLDHPAFEPQRLESLRYVAYGAAPMPPALLDRVLAALPWAKLVQTYGLTEACGPVTQLDPQDHVPGSPRLRSVGRRMPGVELRIVDTKGADCDPGDVGEVWLSAGTLMAGYHNLPERTAAVMVDGWYRTGDVGYLDDLDYLFLLDRADDMIVSGGENVYTSEVEAAIGSHPHVREVAVVGQADPTWGQIVQAIVVPLPGCALTEAEVADHCRDRLAVYKRPRRIHIRTEPLPLSNANKILKRELRSEYAEG